MVRDSVVEAGKRAWESIIDTKDRLVQRGIDAKDRLVARYVRTRDKTTAGLVDLFKRAAVWGLNKIAVPIEDRLRQVYEVPAGIREWQAGREDRRAEKQAIRAKLAQKAGDARVKTLQEEIARIEEATNRQVNFLNGLRDAAQARSSELNDRATARRKQAREIFGKARTAVQSLQIR